ncbi:MAG: ABC-type bacteriocin/lantibiotic exporter with double-glycine peptidase domain [Paracoccaceae bacterium]|jgi:ABC-type bacteriocin/lantibiotic exporter with double-glycine peptidase domain
MLNLYAAIWRVSGRRQIVLIVLSVAIAALAAAPLKFQKEIVNLLTEGDLGVRQLYVLGAGMMAVTVVSLLLKWLMGYLSGILGEDVIRIIRKRLLDGAAEQRQNGGAVPLGTLNTAISAEAEELGKFAGGALSEPVMQIGTLISVIGFIAATQPGLGGIALAMILPQIVLVLLSQRKVNTFVAQRVQVLRSATNKVTPDMVDAAVQSVLADFDEIYETRRKMFVWKLSIKFLLSAINGAGTVAVLMLGGWLVLQGRTDVGTVVAAMMGLGRIQGPTAFLIAFYRQVSANRVKYELLQGVFATTPVEPV